MVFLTLFWTLKMVYFAMDLDPENGVFCHGFGPKMGDFYRVLDPKMGDFLPCFGPKNGVFLTLFWTPEGGVHTLPPLASYLAGVQTHAGSQNVEKHYFYTIFLDPFWDPGFCTPRPLFRPPLYMHGFWLYWKLVAKIVHLGPKMGQKNGDFGHFRQNPSKILIGPDENDRF